MEKSKKIGRPKKKEKMERIDFTIESTEKAKWSNFAKSLGIPLSKAIKESMDKIMYKNESKNNQDSKVKQMLEEMQDSMNAIDKRYFDLLNSISNDKQEKTSNKQDIDKLKDRILIFLRKGPDIREKIEKVIEIDKKQLRIILAEMKKDNQLDYNLESKEWSVYNANRKK